jgi:hypothetical protein
MDDFTAALHRIGEDPRHDTYAALQRAARQAPPEPSIIPLPEFAPGCAVRFPCPLGCSWAHEEHPAIEPLGPIRLPLHFTGRDLSAALTDHADRTARIMRRRVEQAIEAHYETAHPGR